MTKKEICWLVVRLIGICLLFNALRYAVAMIENLLLISSTPAGQMLVSQTAGLMKLWCCEAIASFVAGLYLIKRGHVLFEWLNFEP